MMKGSTNTQAPATTGQQPSQALGLVNNLLGGMGFPAEGIQRLNSSFGKGTTAAPPTSMAPQRQGFNIQDALSRFMGFADGGAAKHGDIEAEIEAALRLARMIGTLTKKL